MKQLRHSRLKRFAAKCFVALLLILTATNGLAGGLVDTSVERFMAAQFTSPHLITNPWWTLTADNSFLYFAEDGDDCVWNLTEVMGTTMALGGDFEGAYAGTNARIVLDRSWVDVGCIYDRDFQTFIATAPAPQEVTYDWYAQDNDKNIWYMGEDTFNGVDKSGSFVAGCDGVEAGIVVLGNPSKGAFYRQEFYEDEAEDWAKVLSLQEMDGLMWMRTKEWTPLEHGAIEHKWYRSNGQSGELALIEERHGKTVIVELVDTNIDYAPSAVGLPMISPIPSCP